MQSLKGLVGAAVLIAIIIVGGIFIFAKPKTSSSLMAIVTPVPQEQNVKIITLTTAGFSPNNVVISVGMRVKWINKTGTVAAVDSDPNTSYPPMNFGNFSNGSSVELVFDKVGTYHYRNDLNPSKTGIIVVQ